MIDWTRDELNRIAEAEELEISPRRVDGKLQKPVTIWVVRLGDDLYGRSVNGRTSGWFRGVLARHEGHIQAGGVDKDVNFVEVDAAPDLSDRIDAAYQTKYRHLAQYVPPTLTPAAKAATIKFVPHSTTR